MVEMAYRYKGGVRCQWGKRTCMATAYKCVHTRLPVSPSVFSIPWQHKGGPKWISVWHIVRRKGSCICDFFSSLFLPDFFIRIIIGKNKFFHFLLPILTVIPIHTFRHWIPRKVEAKEKAHRRSESSGELDLSQGHLGGSLLIDTSLRNYLSSRT